MPPSTVTRPPVPRWPRRDPDPTAWHSYRNRAIGPRSWPWSQKCSSKLSRSTSRSEETCVRSSSSSSVDGSTSWNRRLVSRNDGRISSCQRRTTSFDGDVANVWAAAFVRLRNSGWRRAAIQRIGVGGGLRCGLSAPISGRRRVYMKPLTNAGSSVAAGTPSSANTSRKPLDMPSDHEPLADRCDAARIVRSIELPFARPRCAERIPHGRHSRTGRKRVRPGGR